MSSGEILVLLFIPLFLCLIVDFVMPPLQKYTGIKSSSIFKTSVIVMTLYPTWAALGLLNLPFGGFKTQREVYIALSLYATVCSCCSILF